MHAPFWVAAAQIIWINILLSGDNAVVIALACAAAAAPAVLGHDPGRGRRGPAARPVHPRRGAGDGLPVPQTRRRAALFWVAVKLIVPEDEDGEDNVEAAETVARGADRRHRRHRHEPRQRDRHRGVGRDRGGEVDIAHAAAIKTTLIIFGLATSVPLIIAGSAMLMALLERFPILVWAGGGLLGWVAGDIMVTDPGVIGWLGEASAIACIPGQAASAPSSSSDWTFLVRRHRPFHLDETMAAIGLGVWIAGDLIGAIIPGERGSQGLVGARRHRHRAIRSRA